MTVEAQAKVNLTLEVFGRRSDGYHALRSVVLPVSLADTLEIEAAPAGAFISDTGYPDDLCLKAARLLAAAGPSPGESRGVAIHVTKRIPAGGGLGGGSADAAAVLRALNEFWRLGKSREELAEIGARIGSDVPALVLGGTVLMEGRGEKVTGLDVANRPPLNLVLVNPGVFSSTADVYAHCVPRTSGDRSVLRNMCRALAAGEWRQVAAALTNDLQGPACALHPEIAEAQAALAAAGAEGVLMSGSGSTVFGLVPSEARAREMAARLSARGYWARAVRA